MSCVLNYMRLKYVGEKANIPTQYRKSSFNAPREQYDASPMMDLSGYPLSINEEGYGTTAWAPSLLAITRNFGRTEDGDFIVTYLR
jgi:hypothetical protein